MQEKKIAKRTVYFFAICKSEFAPKNAVTHIEVTF